MRSTETQPIDDECTGGGMIDDHYARLTPPFFPSDVMNELSFSCGISKSINHPCVHYQMFSENIYHQKPNLQPPLSDQGGLHAHKHNITASDEHAAVQAVVAIMDGDICVKSDPKTHGSFYLCFCD